MNKKIFGIKISILLTIVTCLFVSLAIWLLVEHNDQNSSEDSEECVFSEGFDYL